MMTPEEYRAARARASHWVQLRIGTVTPPPTLPGTCLLRGEVTRLFRGTPPAERTIELAVECKKRGQRSPPGDEFRMDLEDLARGRHVEAFMEMRDGRYIVTARQIELVARPGAKPTFTGKQ
jgi:hypothetical protein